MFGKRFARFLTKEELNTAILLIKDKFATFAGCELHSIRYAGDDANNEKNLEWLNSLREVRSNIPPEDVGKQYVQVAEFRSNFHSPVEDATRGRRMGDRVLGILSFSVSPRVHFPSREVTGQRFQRNINRG